MATIRINNFSKEIYDNGYRVSADINGIPLWFESEDASLVPSAEGFAAAMIFTGLKGNSDLVVDAPLSTEWLKNVSQLLSKLTSWWNVPQIAIHCVGEKKKEVIEAECTGLCFTAGADSFYSLRHHHEKRIDNLIYIHGYDIPLSDKKRIESYKKSLVSISAAVGSKAVIMRTNLRQHPYYKGINWSRSHGAAIVAAAYMIEGLTGLIISASFPYAYNSPWGTHWEIDHLWSSERLAVSHFGADLWRTEKLTRMKDDPLVQQHLRVCWEQKNNAVNCCCCEKCLRTMLVLNQCDALDRFITFSDRPVHEIVNEVAAVEPHLLPVYEAFLAQSRFEELSQALKKLIKQSSSSPVPGKIRKKMRKRWKRILRMLYQHHTRWKHV